MAKQSSVLTAERNTENKMEENKMRKRMNINKIGKYIVRYYKRCPYCGYAGSDWPDSDECPSCGEVS